MKENFPDKKPRRLDFDEVTDYLEEGRRLYKEYEIGQREATWIAPAEYDCLPVLVLLASDVHYGSVLTDYQALRKHLDLLESTPNTFVAFNGDDVDFFNAVKHATGMAENPLPPQVQARTMMQKIRDLDRKQKVTVLSHGNHNDFGGIAGQDFYDSFMSEIEAPIFTQGGILNMVHGGVNYRMVLNHTYWGRSKINITNASKRLLEYEGGGTCDIGWVGHTHQASYEQFHKGGREYVAVVSGTYKRDDPWAAKHGIGGRGSPGGITLMLWPYQKQIQVYRDFETACDVMDAMLARYTYGDVDDPYTELIRRLDERNTQTGD